MSSIYNGSEGWVYLARCETMRDGVLKIGSTTNDPNLRAKQLTASTSAPTAFTILYSRKVRDCTAVEAAMHRAFAAVRLNERREFFNVSLFEAAKTLDSLAGSITSNFDDPPTPYAELFATFEDRGDGVLNEDEIAQCAGLKSRLAEERRKKDWTVKW